MWIRYRRGGASPAQGFVEKSLYLNEFCVAHPNATFYVRAQGDSMPPQWSIKRERLSPAYTTRWDEQPKVF